MMYNCTVIESKQQEVVIPTIIRIIPRLPFLEQVTRKGNQEIMQKGGRCRIEVLSPLTRERWRLDRPAVLLANFPSKNKTIRFLPFLPRRIAFLLQLLWLPFFLTFQTQLKVMHTILHLMGVAVTVALTFPTPADFSKNGDFFSRAFFFIAGW